MGKVFGADFRFPGGDYDDGNNGGTGRRGAIVGTRPAKARSNGAVAIGALASARHRLAPAAALVILYAGSAAASTCRKCASGSLRRARSQRLTGSYLGSHLGYAGGNSNRTASTVSGSRLASGSPTFRKASTPSMKRESRFLGWQARNNSIRFPNRIVIARRPTHLSGFPQSHQRPVRGRRHPRS